MTEILQRCHKSGSLPCSGVISGDLPALNPLFRAALFKRPLQTCTLAAWAESSGLTGLETALQPGSPGRPVLLVHSLELGRFLFNSPKRAKLEPPGAWPVWSVCTGHFLWSGRGCRGGKGRRPLSQGASPAGMQLPTQSSPGHRPRTLCPWRTGLSSISSTQWGSFSCSPPTLEPPKSGDGSSAHHPQGRPRSSWGCPCPKEIDLPPQAGSAQG